MRPGDPRDTAPRPVPARELWGLTSGFLIWASALVLVYATHSLGCAFGWPPGATRLALAGVLLAHMALIAVLWRVRTRRGPDPAQGRAGAFFYWVILATLAAALVKIVFTLGPALLLTVCV
jgi:hypothetical protein